MKSSAMRDLMAVTARPEVISLAGGLPDTSTFPPNTFADQLQTLAADGWAVVPLAEALNPKSRRTVALCFDDGFEGVAVYGRPLLDRYGFRATVFACPSTS